MTSDRDRTIAILESETKAFAALFKKEQAKSAAEAQRVMALQAEIESLRKLLTSLSVRTELKHRSIKRPVASQPKKVVLKMKGKPTRVRTSKTSRKTPLGKAVRRKAKRSVH